jgi:hypothetical protein
MIYKKIGSIKTGKAGKASKTSKAGNKLKQL